MKFVTILALGVSLAAVAACNTSTPTSPSGDDTQTFTATLRPSDEVPPITGAESTGNGTATITLNLTRDQSGTVTGAMATFAVTLRNFPAGTPVNMAHIHQAIAGTSGNVVVNTTLTPGEVLLHDGSGSFNKSGIVVTPDIATQLLNNPAAFYFNVHSTANPAGVARGQLVRIK